MLHGDLATRTHVWTVPGPISQVAFFPPFSESPSHYAYGGDQVLLSVCEIGATLSHYSKCKSGSSAGAAEKQVEEEETVSSKKRKLPSRPGKQVDFLPGEVWRAKSLPNDHLSLPQPPSIRTISFITDSTSDRNTFENMKVVVGTKDGLLRTYMPSQKPKHTQEWKITQNRGSIRTVHACPSENALFVGDTQRNLYMVDDRTGQVLFQYKDITGTISDALTFVDSSTGKTLVLATSLDHLIRLFSTGEISGTNQRRRGAVLEQYFTGVENGLVLAWDPHNETSRHGDTENRSESEGEEEDDVWSNMKTIGNVETDQDSDDDVPAERRAEKRQRGAK